MTSNQCLVADIGGTNARFGLAEIGSNIAVGAQHTFKAEAFATLGDAAAHYLDTLENRPASACFAVAGRLHAGEIAFTNSPWRFRPDQLQRHLKLDILHVVNDFEALAAGTMIVPDDYLVPVRAGVPDVNAPKLVIGPGTGLGQALIVPCAGHNKVISTEGGHVAFAPQSELDFKVMQIIGRDLPRVSVERLLCGDGLVSIYQALQTIGRLEAGQLEAHKITDLAITGQDPIAAETMDFFFNALGAAVGDAALSTGARGGIILAGGILPKVEALFRASAFETHFLSKGRMAAFVEPIPIDMIIRDGCALFGAARLLKQHIT